MAASNVTSNFNDVKSAFDSGKYDVALQQLQNAPTDDAVYYYNVGTLFLKAGKNGQAVAYLEKANHLQSHDISTQQNLQIARTALGQSLGTEKLDPASSWTENLADNLRIDEIRGAFGLVGFVVTLFWIRSYLKTRNLKATLVKPAGLLGMFGLGIIAVLYAVEHGAGLSPAGVCLQKQSIRSGPGPQFVDLGVCEAGEKIRILGPTAEATPQPVVTAASPSPTSSMPASLAGLSSPAPTPEVSAPVKSTELWRQIRYSQDGIGWIPSSSLLLL